MNNDKTPIRDIEISKNRKHLDYHSSEPNSINKNNLPPQSTSSYKKKNKKTWPKFAVLGLIFLIIFIAVSLLFHSAKVEVTPQFEEISFIQDNVYQATATLPDTIAPNQIQYELTSLSFSNQEKIDSIGVEEEEIKATGKIKIINNSNEAQQLRKETRFRDGDRIFMTYKSTTIPANSFLIADAFASEAGSKYNLPIGTKFDIPGFEEVDSPLFTQMNGEVAEAFTGGFIGKNNIPNKDDLETAKETARNKLESMANDQIASKIKDDYILVDSESFREFSDEISSQNNKVILTTTITIQAILFKEQDFIKMILDSEDDDLKIKDISSLNFTILSKNLSVAAADDFNFNLQGKIKIYRQFDEEAFITMIKDNSKDEVYGKIENNFKNFDIEISTTPFWRSSIPNSKEKIEIEINK